MEYNFHQPPISRVPGDTNFKNQYVLKDLEKLTRRELMDIKSRQLRLLENKKWLDKLPDKGEKIKDLYERVVKALEYKNEVHNTANLLSSMSLGTSNLNNLEWEGTTQSQRRAETIDSDDEEIVNPLQILACSSSVFSNRKIIKDETKENKPLVTEQDIVEIEKEGIHVDPVLEKICKMDKLETCFRFLPHKSTEQECPLKKNQSKQKPVNIQNQKCTEAISLAKSIVIEHNCQKNRRELLEKQAMERLEAKKKELEAAGLIMLEIPTIVPAMTNYRLPPQEFDDEIVRNKNDEDDLSDDSLSDEDEI